MHPKEKVCLTMIIAADESLGAGFFCLQGKKSFATRAGGRKVNIEAIGIRPALAFDSVRLVQNICHIHGGSTQPIKVANIFSRGLIGSKMIGTEGSNIAIGADPFCGFIPGPVLVLHLVVIGVRGRNRGDNGIRLGIRQTRYAATTDHDQQGKNRQVPNPRHPSDFSMMTFARNCTLSSRPLSRNFCTLARGKVRPVALSHKTAAPPRLSPKSAMLLLILMAPL